MTAPSTLNLMRAVWPRTDLDAKEKAVLLALLQHADDRLRCWPSLARLSIYASHGRRAVQYAISSLEARGFITVDRNAAQGGSSLYRIRPESWPQTAEMPIEDAPEPDAQGGAPDARGVQQMHGGVHQLHPNFP